MAKQNLSLPPYLGSTLRGGFGHAFKRIACSNPKGECHICLLKERCVYYYVFESLGLKVSKGLKRYRMASPHPFLIEPSDEFKQGYQMGDEIEFNLVLIGKAIDYLPYFICAFDELGRLGLGKEKGKSELKEVFILSFDTDKPIPVYDAQSKQLLNNYQIITPIEILKQVSKYKDRQHLTINFVTPTRIKHQEKITDSLSFDLLITNLIRRLSILSYFYCDEKLEVSYDELIARAKSIKTLSSNLGWYDLERYSNRQKTRMKLGGFLDRVTYEGENLSEFLPLLLIGSLIHIGKATTFGLGKYKLE